ncbi:MULTISPECIES: type I-F CRISPR-associated protein Csy2 [Halomonadaceae]|uniref:type I-F CRISPR-associated protein Csy2 n=1 Tax=Halomonadaceae TaxID=28256 RepID=UPI0012F28A94|nr:MULTISPECIES: type I-F CRISPR-associated protein Csy2 [Halomonas]CAD5247807.1 CRISPR-associated protein Csy2 [Halomonas sp. I3]CAD5269070.1 CRISPR-associated protein Csy2 [Halomonas sp. 113]CAD5270996.1 CRISPR-associated protein Csy2 [Halomonas sp. 59]CAD5282534.1 CRISPR-associated protein Csy2 [Halomonas sp. 156]VXB72132.1 CRISPR-associated protein Csy2 [Halomonas titanicae]
MSEMKGLLVLPRLRVQNANAISSPMTWGFPAMSAFVGLMHALERKLAEASLPVSLGRVGVICHDFEAQATEGGYIRGFHLTRNPVDKTGGTAAIVEEGRIHLDITLIFAIDTGAAESEHEDIAHQIREIVSGMRIAGGSVVPNRNVSSHKQRPQWVMLDDNEDERYKQFARLKRHWLPGFALTLRDDYLTKHLTTLQKHNPEASLLDAWLDLSRLNHVCTLENEGEPNEKPVWQTQRPYRGWLVPIPVGYGAISDLFQPGEVANARDTKTPFRFVESLYSIGEWVSPHRMKQPEDLLWYVDNDEEAGLYRLNNDYHLRATAQ